MTRMTLDTIGLAGFGYDFGSFDRGETRTRSSSRWSAAWSGA